MKKFFLLMLVGLMFYSCTEEQVSQELFTTSSSEELLKEMKSISKTNKSRMAFEVTYENGTYSIKSQAQAPLSWEESFEAGFAGKNQGGVEVRCITQDGGSTVTYCPSGEGQGGCVGSAVASCIGKARAVAMVYVVD